ncbi:MAG: hypothetical protein Q4E24_09725 [bacterium]|nr:hypothetical protein [bacterium]
MYKGIFSEEGNVVEDEDAYDYALERCLHGTEAEQQEFKDMLVEWYYSGDWLKEEEEN